MATDVVAFFFSTTPSLKKATPIVVVAFFFSTTPPHKKTTASKLSLPFSLLHHQRFTSIAFFFFFTFFATTIA
jgi:hypothetical protein